MDASTKIIDSKRHRLLTGTAYLFVALFLISAFGWADLELYRAQAGLGYWFGIIGTTLMALLMLYPVRKRVKALANWGPVRYWFRTHMIFGVLGPVLIILHSNFTLGSLNSRIALFCTIIVASSGIIGRYLYAKLHYGLYGHSASLMSLRSDIAAMRESDSSIGKILPTLNEELTEWENRVLSSTPGVFKSFIHAIAIEFTSRAKLIQLRRVSQQMLEDAGSESAVVMQHRARLAKNIRRYAGQRVSLVRKFAQFRAAERLFSLWHIVHYPLFILMVLAATVHIFAVHVY